jgi:uncharacterized membrane protein YkvA (DUF1232 family)
MLEEINFQKRIEEITKERMELFTKEYTDVSLKVILVAVGSFIYLINLKDLIPDRIPIIGMLDDIAVVGLALEMVKPELKGLEAVRANTEDFAVVRLADGVEPQIDAGGQDAPVLMIGVIACQFGAAGRKQRFFHKFFLADSGVFRSLS